MDQTPVATIARLEAETEAVLQSVLAPWQKLHALRAFIVPQLEFNLKTARIRKAALRSLDSKIKCGVKRIFNVPSRASAELVLLSPSCGGAGLVPLADLSDLAAINHAFRFLTSPDARVASLALEGLAASAGQRSAARAGMEFLVGYLNGDFSGNSNVATTFSTARAALNRLKKRLPDLRWGWCAGRATFQITIPRDRALRIVDRGSRHTLSANLRSSLQQHFRAILSAKPDQGRVARVTTTCATAKHMLHEGRYTRFADWRFVHRARLNVLPLNGSRRWGVNDRRCRRCGQHDETTAHVLCHCTSSLATGITRRQNAVQDLLVAAIRPAEGVEVRVNQRVPLQALLQGRDDFPEEMVRCRPDVVMIDAHNKIVKIVDIAVPYEDGWRAIEAARERKLDTYGPLARMLTAGGYRTSVDAFVVGSLGAWDSANWGTLARLGIHRRYGKSLPRRCVSEAIRWSRDICHPFLRVEKGKKKKEEEGKKQSTLLHFIVGRKKIFYKFNNMYWTEGVLSSTLEKQLYEIDTTIVEMNEFQKRSKQKIKAFKEVNVMLQVEILKEKTPMQEISLHRKDGDVDLLNFTARHFAE
ncbi:uncharacterized protein LOC124358478 [Homalodisca vitripennis]|uniref:uncharacterized protein LOC124358478 n=1 Tax=Homalodisca vitripennis TaxID=197043 RepID=UPI001EECA3E7|nr:uncharacterized protein LOC124358478 [Homalodisca vitripennis]